MFFNTGRLWLRLSMHPRPRCYWHKKTHQNPNISTWGATWYGHFLTQWNSQFKFSNWLLCSSHREARLGCVLRKEGTGHLENTEFSWSIWLLPAHCPRSGSRHKYLLRQLTSALLHPVTWHSWNHTHRLSTSLSSLEQIRGLLLSSGFWWAGRGLLLF